LPNNSAFLYCDEAGNYDFTEQGSKYFLVTCVVMTRTFDHCIPLYALKYDRLQSGIDIDRALNCLRFHASYDVQALRDDVYKIIVKNLSSFSVYTAIIDKDGLDGSQRNDYSLYAMGMIPLLDAVLETEDFDDVDSLTIVTDSIPGKRRWEAVRGAMKSRLKKWTTVTGRPFLIYHHLSSTDMNLQVVDYVSWAIQRKWERDDERSYVYIKDAIIKELLVCGQSGKDVAEKDSEWTVPKRRPPHLSFSGSPQGVLIGREERL